MQALPYDFRVDYRENALDSKFGNVVNRLHEITGKKVSIIAHSFGNYQTVNYLWNSELKEKEEKIARYIALAPPFVGAAKISLSMLGMDPSFTKKFLFANFGLTPNSFKHAFVYYQGVYNLMVHDVFEPNKDKEWLKAVKSRIEAEKTGKDMKNGTVMDMFPSVNEVCNEGFEERAQGKCHTFLDWWVDYGEIQGKQVNAKTMPKILKQFSYSKFAEKLYKQGRDSRFVELPNLGVQTNIIYGAGAKTMRKFQYNRNPKDFTKNDKMLRISKSWDTMGDGSVTTTSAILPGIKWADDFDKKVKGAKPVNLIEICSKFKRRKTVFEEGKKVVEKNAYFGIDCECAGSKKDKEDGRDCSEHNTMLEDVKVVQFLLDSCTDGQKGKVGEKFRKMSKWKLRSYVRYCHLFNDP
jgi:hypothetical protein